VDPRTAEFEAKMRQAGSTDAAIIAFKYSYDLLVGGDTGLIPEAAIEPVSDLPWLDDIAKRGLADPRLLSQVAVIKLNGGLGTSMGLERAKSLLPVKEGLTFLDFIARHILHLRTKHRVPLRFMLMDSFSTSRDTLEFLKRYPELGAPESLELMQNQVPKVDAKTLCPVLWQENPQLEWCPPGHGDIYPSLLGSGWLDRLLGEGIRFLFVSNSDNLGASVDLDLLGYMKQTGLPILMEVAERTASDRKGGHLARRNGRFLLRELAQCPEPDMTSFQDIERHRFFNTNNLWIRLDQLKKLLEVNGGFVPLPIIKNAKTVDPRNKTSPAVFQLETAMGAAIGSFEKSGAVVVPRTRFAPVKTTSDLFALRSDAYEITEDWRIVLRVEGQPPTVDLDPEHYKLTDQLDEKLAGGVPSLQFCRSLAVRGPVLFNSGNVFRGDVSVHTKGPAPRPLPPGEYQDREVTI
jgi:UDP-N-acetylglucosamine pyrophosphorylase